MGDKQRAIKFSLARVVYVRNPSRAHKILPLLEGTSVVLVKRWRDVLKLRRVPSAGTAVMLDNFGRWGILGSFISIFLRAPLVIRLRGEYFREERERFADRSGLLRWPRYVMNVILMRLYLRRSRMVICNSEYLAQAMMPYLKGKLIKIVYNPCTVAEQDPDQLRSSQLPEKGFHLLTVTNMNLYSKVQPTLEAIGEWLPPLLWKELDIHWIVCGAGHHEDRLAALIHKKGLEDRVHLLGQVENVSELYKWCDVLVHFTRMDAFPNVTMEAMSHERPVITNADSCGTREQVRDRENGRVVDNAASFVSALRDYAKDAAIRDRHGRAGRELVRKSFSVEAQRRAMESALNELFLYDHDKGLD